MNITADQAIHELKMGRAIKIGKQAILHPEFAAKLPKNAKLLITKKRAEKLFGKKFNSHVEVDLKNIALPEIQRIIACTTAKKLSYKPSKLDITKLATWGELIPAFIIFETKQKLPILKNLKSKISNLKLVATAPLNLREGGKATIHAFREDAKISEHFAIVVGKPGSAPLVRVHSCCYTGDLLGSLSCDCQDQLRGALTLMNKNGGGILVYLMQEGRGIGLINKLRAYDLQAKGLDTVEANEFLGFEDEERGFTAAANILKKLGVKKIQLISNNPKKAKELEADGIKVEKLVPMIIKHEHNSHYLGTKARKSGHLIK
jgi:GTP cyclohydrolase II